jgi:hypothetical protein
MLPVAAETGTGVSDGVAAHAAVDRIEGGHQPTATGLVACVEQVRLGGCRRAEFGQQDATFAVTDAGAEEVSQSSVFAVLEGAFAEGLARVVGRSATATGPPVTSPLTVTRRELARWRTNSPPGACCVRYRASNANQ